MNRPAVNPFGDLIVKDPRRSEPTVTGLNEKPFRRLVQHFKRLTEGEAPRELISPEAAQLVSSEQPGYGKSHLIGRLFRQLHGRATLVYVLPFQNASSVFQSMVLAVLREMHFPDRMGAGSWDREEPTQLDHFAHAVLAHILADVVVSGKDVHAEEAERNDIIERLRTNPLEAFNRGVEGPNWAEWLRSFFPKLRAPFEDAVARKGLTLASPWAWLRVLYAYTFHPFDLAVRRACIDWITCQPLDADDAKNIGLNAAESVSPDITPEDANELCRQRLVELCQLASFFRPFVFCFDQTEVYGHHARLARAFGKVIAVLINEAPNHLSLITCNQEPWAERIQPYMEKADLDRIARPAVTLEGLNRDQARELARIRMESVDVPAARADGFLDERWIEELFPTPRNQMGTRLFLQKCKERWEAEPVRKVPIAELYQQRVDRLLTSPKRHQFEPDTLQWLIQELGARIPDTEVSALEEKYFQVSWKAAGQTRVFGFVPGSHWQRWLSIARECERRAQTEGAGGFKAVFLRTPYQAPIPGPNWKSAPEINAARSRCLHIITLSLEDLARMYAARDLYAEAAQGDIAASSDDVLDFLAQELSPWWARILGPTEPPAESPPAPQERPESPDENAQELGRKLRTIVEAARFLSLDEAIAGLNGLQPTREEVLAACGFSPEIRVHSHPNMIVLQWQANA